MADPSPRWRIRVLDGGSESEARVVLTRPSPLSALRVGRTIPRLDRATTQLETPGPRVRFPRETSGLRRANGIGDAAEASVRAALSHIQGPRVRFRAPDIRWRRGERAAHYSARVAEARARRGGTAGRRPAIRVALTRKGGMLAQGRRPPPGTSPISDP
jgi:hypothetical protein